MKWDEMSPRERDALVAEKVMGWTPNEDEKVWWTDNNGYLRWLLGEPKTGVWSPSTDLSAAWEVVQKLKPTHSFELRVGKYAESARFTQQLGVGDGSEFIAQREHAPESICLAALRAVGVDV